MSQHRHIAILGATGHIGKSLVACYLSREESLDLHLFVRDMDKMRLFMELLPVCIGEFHIAEFENFPNDDYDLVINCVGFSSPLKRRENLTEIFRTNARFDDMVLKYLSDHPLTLYVNLSSGAVYGFDFSKPVDEKSHARFHLNNFKVEEFYGIAKLYYEAKHRALSHLNIVDLRVFGYFSRYINLSEKFLLSEIISCLKNKQVFVTGPDTIWRDFLHPEDLVSLINSCQLHCPLNCSYDAYSRKEASKFEILDFFVETYGLKYEIDELYQFSNETDYKSHYYSAVRKAKKIGYLPAHSSIDGIRKETAAIIGEHRPS